MQLRHALSTGPTDAARLPSISIHCYHNHSPTRVHQICWLHCPMLPVTELRSKLMESSYTILKQETSCVNNSCRLPHTQIKHMPYNCAQLMEDIGQAIAVRVAGIPKGVKFTQMARVAECSNVWPRH